MGNYFVLRAKDSDCSKKGEEHEDSVDGLENDV